MYYNEIKETDIANIMGIGVSLFVSGCRNHCKGCFNQETWDFYYGKLFTDETLNHILSIADKSYNNGLSVLGGEPMEVENRAEVLKLVKSFRKKYPKKQIYLFSGYYYEDLVLQDTALDILRYIDVLVDSPFEIDKKDLSLTLRGSSNQRIIDIPNSLQQSKVVLVDL